ncbi:MAG: hypothetical protein AAF495_24635 [Pseudomonadota bacterium]
MAEPFKKNKLFGREPHIAHLMARARQPGLTAVVARPTMGKTWTLIEVARRLTEEGVLVGYHESKGAESSHLLYAAADLYGRWLSDSTLRAQAQSVWERQTGYVTSSSVRAVGQLLEDVDNAAPTSPEAIQKIVEAAFHELATLPYDKEDGDLPFARLNEEQARDLTTAAWHLSERPIVLILDAWEASPCLHIEISVLEDLANRLEVSSETHIFLGIQHPGPVDRKGRDEAYSRAMDLVENCDAAEIYELLPFGGEPLPDTPLDQLLPTLSSQELVFAVRLSCLPRLDEVSWMLIRDQLFGDLAVDTFQGLINALVLEDAPYPSLGPDLRHWAARRWFANTHLDLMRVEATNITWRLAGQIACPIEHDRGFATLLAACAPLADIDLVDGPTECLIACALPLFGKDRPLFGRKFESSWRAVIEQDDSVQDLVLGAVLHRGNKNFRHGNTQEALQDYSAVIEQVGAPCDRVAQALLLRGDRKSEIGDVEGATEDFTAVVEMPSAPSHRVANALIRRGETRAEFDDTGGAIEDFGAVVAQDDLSTRLVVKAFANRGALKGLLGDTKGAIEDLQSARDLSNELGDPLDLSLIDMTLDRFEEN